MGPVRVYGDFNYKVMVLSAAGYLNLRYFKLDKRTLLTNLDRSCKVLRNTKEGQL